MSAREVIETSDGDQEDSFASRWAEIAAEEVVNAGGTTSDPPICPTKESTTWDDLHGAFKYVSGEVLAFALLGPSSLPFGLLHNSAPRKAFLSAYDDYMDRAKWAAEELYTGKPVKCQSSIHFRTDGYVSAD